MIEALVAVTILAIAILLTIPPIVASMSSLQRSEQVTVAENLAQGEIEKIRSLAYDDVGLPGFSPDGVLDEVQTITIGNEDYTVETSVKYAGSATGNDVIAQGGDGVQGLFDPGVDYKHVIVTVTPARDTARAVTMDTIIAPATIGAHEDLANLRVNLTKVEPFGSVPDPWPKIKTRKAPSGWINSFDAEEVQVFPGLTEDGTYEVDFSVDNGWKFHPVDVASGGTNPTLTQGLTTNANLRIYQPVELEIDVVDQDTGLPISNAVVELVPLGSGVPVGPVAQTTFTDLVPDNYDVSVSASGYLPTWIYNEAISGDPLDGDHDMLVKLEVDPTPSVAVTFTTQTWIRSGTYTAIHGASVRVVNSSIGFDQTIVTNADGEATFSLPESTSGFTATGTSPWGHADDTQGFSTGTGPASYDLDMNRPSNSWARMVLHYGTDIDYAEYRESGYGWESPPLLANNDGIATFVDRRYRRYYWQGICPDTSTKDTGTHYLNNTTETWYSGGSC